MRYQYDAQGDPYGLTYSGTVTLHGEPTKCWDFVHTPPYGGKRDALTITSVKAKPARFNMPWSNYAREQRRITNVPLLPSSTAPIVWEAGWQALLYKAVASIQDSGPIADVPTSVAEAISDIPRMAMSILGVIASGWLSYHWALKPLNEDLKKLQNLTNEISKRLERHRKKLRTKRWTGSGNGVAVLTSSGSSSSNQAVNGSETVISLQTATLEENRAWWVASLSVREGVDIPGFMKKQWSNGFQTGATDPGVIVRTLYELIPWSWLIDYFATLGTLVKYHSNQVVYDVPAISLMATYTLKRTISPSRWSSGGNKNWGNVTPGYTKKTWKRRQIHYSPGVGIAIDPLLTWTQIANLFAVASSLRGLQKTIDNSPVKRLKTVAGLATVVSSVASSD